MDDLLQLKKHPSKLNQLKNEDQTATVGRINQMEHQPHVETTVKCKEKPHVNHKRPSLSYDFSNSKRVKGQDTIKPTPQLLQQLITTSGCNQKNRTKVQAEPSTSNGGRWSPLASPLKEQQQQQQTSNSVLMNLLVSGCDVSAGYYTCLPRPKVAKA